MKYVVTGATGHIGNTIVRELIKQGKEVKVLVRRVDKSIIDLPIEYCIGDIFNESFLQEHINNDDIVFHLAGIIDLKNKLEQLTYQVNYLGTKTIIDYCVKSGVKRFIYFSSVDAIGKLRDGALIKEPTEFHMDLMKGYYGKSKALATKYVMQIQKEHPEMTISILYPTAVIGINDYKPSYIGKVIKDCLAHKMQFGIKGGYDFVDVEDIARFSIKVCDDQTSESYILSGNQISVYQLYDAINKEMKINKKVIHIPLFIARLSIPFVPYLSKFTIDTLLDQSKYDASKAIKRGFVVTSFNDTIKKAVMWHQKNSL